MKYYTTRFILFTLFFSVLANVSAQEKKNQTLLWRIQKDGGSPSFLFGTMHISDKKAFNFQDSLYTYLQQAEAFALEFNPDSANQIIAAYMSGELDLSYTWEPTDQSPALPPDTLSFADSAVSITQATISVIDTVVSTTDSLTTAVRFPIQRDRNVVEQFTDRLARNKKREEESMNTFMDAYLFEMASRQGKRIYGLEELEGKSEVVRALSMGLKAKKFELFSKWDSQNEESAIHRLYFEEDLDSLDLYYQEFFNEESLDIFLYARNKMMVHRMDSIMKNQTLFSAVGAGHLKGEKGIIALLRGKGYTVEPVFSKKRIPAEKIQLSPGRSNWQVVKRAEYGFQVSMPGMYKTQDGANGKKIIYHYDLGGGSFFMISFGMLRKSEKEQSFNEVVSGHLDEWLRNAGGRVVSRKMLEYDGQKMMEAVCLYSDNSYYRYRETIKGNLYYILAVGSEKKENLYTEKAEEFVKSFRTTEIPSANWSNFSAPAEGFTILFPGKPQTEVENRNEEGAISVTMRSYSWFDANNGISYLVSTAKASAGHEYVEGETFFNTYTDYITQVSTDTPVFTDTTMDGYAGKYFTGGSASNKLMGFVLRRGNTSYYVIAEFENHMNARAGADKFLASFKMTGFKSAAWSLQQSPGMDFSAWLPGEIKLKSADSTAYDFNPAEIAYFGHDPYAAISYNIEVYPISKYYWSPNLDSIYNSWQEKTVSSWSDSLLKVGDVSNGRLRGRQIWKIGKSSKEQSVLRLLLNGDTMYVLTTVLPRMHADQGNIDRFFESFRVKHVKSADILLRNGPEMLFADLQSKDSVTFSQAYNALSEVDFLEADIMLLMEKSLISYPRSFDGYRTINEILLQKASEFFKKNETVAYRAPVIDFIKKNYLKENTQFDSTRFFQLGIIATDKTQASYQTIMELLPANKRFADSPFSLFYKLYDSLALTSTMYPGLLEYLGDTTMNFSIVSLTKALIDSNLLDRGVLLPVKTKLLDLARKERGRLLKGNMDDTGNLPDLIELLGLLQQKEADEMISGFLKTSDIPTRKSAALALLRNKKAVPSSVVAAIANDLQHRVEFFTALKDLQKERLFPADHRSQVDFAESYIFTSVFDEYEDEVRPEMVFIKKVEYEYKGKQKSFYIFRANYEYDHEDSETGEMKKVQESYFTVGGPFDIDESILTIDESENISGAWYDEQFDGMKNDYFFTKYIAQRLEWQNHTKK